MRSQGFGCSPIKAVRELGSERRETVKSWLKLAKTVLSINLAKCWKLCSATFKMIFKENYFKRLVHLTLLMV